MGGGDIPDHYEEMPLWKVIIGVLLIVALVTTIIVGVAQVATGNVDRPKEVQEAHR